jgi:DNA-directed RNA polymerase specialized sigma24 family protein
MEHTVPASLPDLAASAAAGDPRALDALARWAQPVLAALVRRALARERCAALDLDDAAEELLAEVQGFLAGAAGVPGWARFRAARCRGEVEAWLYGIVRNKARRRLRDLRRRDHALAALAWAAPSAAAPERAVDGARALRLAGGLPGRERAVLALWLTDASSREIAERLRFASPHAVDCCLARGKARLRRMMLGEEELRAA